MIKKNWKNVFLLVAMMGALISLYATYHQLQVKIFGRSDAACNINHFFNCDQVAKSHFAEIYGIPLGIFGLGYFLAIAVSLFSNHLAVYTLLTTLGVLASIALSTVSFFFLEALCLICLSFYVVTFLQMVFLLLLKRKNTFSYFKEWNLKKMAIVGMVFILTLSTYKLLETNVEELLSNPKYASKTNHFLKRLFVLQPKEIPFNPTTDIWIGNKEAKVRVVEYFDFMCPYCQEHMQGLLTLSKEYKDRVLFIVKLYASGNDCNPLAKNRGHSWTCENALIGNCLWEKNLFWEYFNAFYKAITPANSNGSIHTIAIQKMALSNDVINACLNSENNKSKIRLTAEEATILGATATPAIFINGFRYTGPRTLEAIRYELDIAL